MSNNYFRFKNFTLFQDRCAMKVGTDGTLLGAWAHGGHAILDIGTGTGLIALMMAQRYPDAEVTAVDIDAEAVEQARDNVSRSPFGHISVFRADVRQLEGAYDCIVCNPPFFDKSLLSPDGRRTLARHTTTLSYRELMQAVSRLLTDEGECSLVIPSDAMKQVENEAIIFGLFKHRFCSVRTLPTKPPRRCLLSFTKQERGLLLEEGVIESAPNVRSEWYECLTKNFYL